MSSISLVWMYVDGRESAKIIASRYSKERAQLTLKLMEAKGLSGFITTNRLPPHADSFYRNSSTVQDMKQ